MPNGLQIQSSTAQAEFSSQWSKMGTAAKIALSGLTLGLGPLMMWAKGGFRETLKLYNPSKQQHIDTGATRADLQNLKPANSGVGGLADSAKRKIALNILGEAGALDGMRLTSQVKSETLFNAVQKLANNKENPFAELQAEHENLKGDVLDAETLRMLDELGTMQNTNALEGKITYAEPPVAEVNQNRPEQTEREKQMRNFFGEIIFPKNPAEARGPQGARLKELCKQNADVLLEIYKDPAVMEEAGLPKEMSSQFSKILEDFKNNLLPPNLPLPNENQLRKAIEKAPAESFDDLDNKINEEFAKLDFTKLADTKQLGTLMDDNPAAGNFGKFMKQVFEGYFNEQPVVDRRAMIGSFLRESRAKDSEPMKLVGMLKGAGPYMQKILQLFGDQASGELKEALGELKTGLSPIDSHLKEAMFADIIKQSNGAIAEIKDLRSLGAASVGETLLAKVTDQKGVERNVVIKLLRPGITQRAARERDFFENVAKGIPGMEGTFAGIANQIDEEMDLSKEGVNVQKGDVYNRTGASNVKAMKLVDGLEPKPQYMIIERAPGGTVKKTLDTIRKGAQDPATSEFDPTEGKFGYSPLEAGPKLAKCLYSLSEKWIEEGLFGGGFYHGDLHGGNIMFSANKGPEGELTAIDFGNATTLSKSDRKAILKMVLAAGVQAPTVFVNNFEQVLSEDGRKLFNEGETKQRFLQATTGILNARTEADSNAAVNNLLQSMGKEPLPDMQGADKRPISPGEKIKIILGAANTLGMEIPAAIANFSRSQMMLQTAIDDVNSLNRKSYDAVKDQIPTAQFTVTAYKEVMLPLVDDASAGAEEFKSAYNQDPVNQEKLLSLVQQGKVKFITPNVEGKKLNVEDQNVVSHFKKNLVIACAKKPEILDFTDIIMGVAMRNKMAAASLTFGDWIKLLKKV